MRRSVRILAALCSTASLLVFLTATLLCVRSFFATDIIVRGERHQTSPQSVEFRSAGMYSARGRLGWVMFDMTAAGPGAEIWMQMGDDSGVFRAGWQYRRADTYQTFVSSSAHTREALGFIIDSEHDEQELSLGEVRRGNPPTPNATLGRSDQTHIAVPDWAMMLLAGALPGWQITRSIKQHRRRHRLRAGCCPSCGYDLRESPMRCPECGRTAESAAVPTKPTPPPSPLAPSRT